MEATKTSGGTRFYRPELDVVRFLAFLLVFIHHVLPPLYDPRITHLLKGFAPTFFILHDVFRYGLSLFFTLSAYLICELLIRERDTAGSVEVKQFYIRRILRIWPLYYFGLALGVAASFGPDGHASDVARIGWFAIFLGAWNTAFHGYVTNPVRPLWSISVEEQFYVFAPWVVKYFNRKALYGFCAALLLLSNACLFYLGKASASDPRIWTDSLVQFECFAAGILLCIVLQHRLPAFAAWHRLLLVVGCCSCWLCASYLTLAHFSALDSTSSWQVMCAYALIALGSAFIIAAFLGIHSKHVPAWAVYLGRISFGLYVYHEFAIYVSATLLGHYVSFSSPIYYLKAVLAVGLTFFAAALSYRYLETPFLKMKKRHSVVESQPLLNDQ
jgi:peptidoglycan/LPS O-acetylase OafA/YrhL